MANISVTVPDAMVPRIIAGLGYQATLPDGAPNPQTGNQFVQMKIRDFLKNAVTISESEQARQSAVDKATSDFG